MNIAHYLFLMSFNIGVVRLTLTVSIPNPPRQFEHGEKRTKVFVRKIRTPQADNNCQGSAQDEISCYGSRDKHPETTHVFENKHEEWQEQHEFQPENKIREESPNPNLHRHNIHSNINTHAHGDVQAGHFFRNPVITHISSVILPPATHQWHQSHKLFNTGNINENFDVSHHAYGVHIPVYDSFNAGSNSHGGLQPNTKLITDQHIYLDTHLINNQNSNLFNQNNHLLNIQIAKLNGHDNVPSQSSNKNIHSHSGTNLVLTEDDIRRTNSENGNFQTDDTEFQDQSQRFDLGLQEKLSKENANSAIYDSEMSGILNVLDMRSYLQVRPKVKISPHYVKKHMEPVTFKKSVKEPQECTCTLHEPEVVQNLKYEGQKGSENDQVNENFLGNIIQIPYNSKFNRWDNIRVKRSFQNRNFTILPAVATLTLNISNGSKPSSKYSTINHNNSSKHSTPGLFPRAAIPLRISNHHFENLNDTLEEYRSMINHYRKGIKQKEETIFADFLDGFVDDFQNKELINSNGIRKIKKRSAPIVRLFNNPNMKLDVPKTLENIGTITRNAFEDKRAPMYHVRNLMGSTKNAVLSAMRIPPQNFIIPSNYQIENINPEEISDGDEQFLGSINRKMLSRSNFANEGVKADSEEDNEIRTDPFGIVETFKRVGSAIRDSVRSGQNTLSHIGDIAHNARKIYHTTKNTVPRIIIPYAKAPVVMRSRFKDDNKSPTLKKAVIITPKVMAIKEPMLGSQNSQPDYVKMGNILDALGISKPDKDQLDLERFVIKTPGKGNVRGIYIPPIGEVRSVDGNEIPTLESARKTLNRLKEKASSTSRNVKEVLIQIKNDAANTVSKTKNQVEQAKKNIANTLDYRKRKNDELSNTLLKNAFRSNGDYESRLGGVLDNSRRKVRNFTKEEEKEIIDKFLDNIFKMDKKIDVHSKLILNTENEKQDYKNPQGSSGNKRNHLRHLKKKPNYYDSKNEIKFSPAQSLLRTDDEINELMTNLTMGFPIIENRNNSSVPMKTRKWKTHHPVLLKKEHTVKPEIVLGSRFAGNNEVKMQEVTPHSSNTEELSKDEEAIRKVDEYVVNDIASMRNDEDMQHFIEETPENDDEVTQSLEENASPYEGRTLLWIPEDETNDKMSESKHARPIVKRSSDDEVVGLDLPPELLKPFMARASDSEVEHVFKNRENVEEVVGSAPAENFDDGDSNKQQLIYKKHYFENSDRGGFSSMSPSNLLEKMRSRASVIDRNGAVYGQSEEQDEAYENARNSGKKDDTELLEKSRREKENSGNILCSSSTKDINSPILCGNSYDNSGGVPRNEDARKFEQIEESGVGQSRNAMLFADNLKKPFMGLENKDAAKKFYEEYNGHGFMDPPDDSEERLLYSDDYK